MIWRGRDRTGRHIAPGVIPVAALLVLCVAAGPGPAAAEALAEAPPGGASCSGCHSPTPGVGAAVPSLVGLDAPAIASAMAAYRTGERPSTVMGRIARGFSEEENRAIAAWIAAGSRSESRP